MQPPSIITLQQHSRRLSADLETPISLFLSLTRDQTPGLLLESAEVDGKWGRYSVIACDYLMTVSCADARLSLTVSDDRLASLKELDGMPYLDGCAPCAAAGTGGRRQAGGPHHAGPVRLLRV